MSMSPLLFLRLLLLLAAASGAVSRDDKFNCRFIFDGALHNTACKVALFHSLSSFYFDSHRIYVAPEDDLCSLDAHLQSIPTAVRQAAARHIVAVRRGSCSFLTKSEVATSAGYAGLIIINTGGEEPFPFGEQEDLSSQLVPAVMVESGFEQAARHWCAKSDSEACLVDRSILSYVSLDADPPADNMPDLHMIFFTVTMLLILLVVAPLTGITCEHALRGSAALLLSFLLIMALSLLTKLGTFRRLHNSVGASGIQHVRADGSVIFYNHKETDEKIFEYLVGAVSRDYTSYYLPPEIISQFRLAPENYGDELFIHPPLFVLLNVAGQKLAGLPLPATSLLCHIVTCLMVLLLPAGLLNFFTPGTYNSAACQRVSLWAVVVYTFCPIVTFVSQKVWIDNAAVMCVSIAAVVHLHVSTKCRDEMAIASHGTKSTRSKILHPANSIFIGVYCSALQFSSGLVFGGLALNLLFGPTTEPRDILSIRLVFKLFQVLGALMVGILCGHGPWLYIYWSTTGRILPNSWPSATMLANSPFVANAVSKNVTTYFRIILEYSPIHIVGVASSIVYCARICFTKCSSARLNSDVATTDAGPLVPVLATWPLAFFAGFTILGVAGAGFQSRFILPALPATAIMTSFIAFSSTTELFGGNPGDKSDVNQTKGGHSFSGHSSTVVAVLFVIGSFHNIYYCVLYPTLFADFEHSFVDILNFILLNPLKPLESKAALGEMSNFMIHHGLKIAA